MRKYIISLLLCLCLTGCAEDGSEDVAESSYGQQTEEQYLIDSGTTEDPLMQALESCIKIEAAETYGSGVIYEERKEYLWVVTAAHVVQSAQSASDIKIFLTGDISVGCENYYLLSEADLAFLQVAKEDLPDSLKGKIRIVQKDREVFDALQGDAGVFLEDKYGENEFGFRFAMVKENWIYVEDFSQHMILLSGEADAGMSGGGVFTENGCFLGIICGANEEGELAVLPYSIIETYLSNVYQSDY
ncbi:MAG: trypsin-like peptidase domain-containing protein [Lachnospiraceae bacterium]|nr:trypsin-like peptidase domain-containing protein [Lachnospiraceae bacterium]